MDLELTRSLTKLCKLYIYTRILTKIQSSILYEVRNLLLVDRKYFQEVEYFYYSETCIYTIYNQVNQYKI
jgi:hypothetical protein